jgi:hypothetical protein
MCCALALLALAARGWPGVQPELSALRKKKALRRRADLADGAEYVRYVWNGSWQGLGQDFSFVSAFTIRGYCSAVDGGVTRTRRVWYGGTAFFLCTLDLQLGICRAAKSTDTRLIGLGRLCP